MATALVTGGTSGIGRAFVTALAARGDDVVIVARDTDRMAAMQRELSAEYGVEIEILPADLSSRKEIERVAERIEDPNRPIDLLVNNAGFGLHRKLLDRDTEIQERAFFVMAHAVFLLSAAAGRAMTERGHGRIINVASTSAWINSGNYSAIKAWALSFTEALAIELSGTGVTATALCPGWVKTEFHSRAGIKSSTLPSFVWVDVHNLVAEALADAERGKVVSIPSFKWKVEIFFAKHLPRPVLYLVTRMLQSSRRPGKQ